MTDHLLNVQDQLVRAEKLASVGRLAAGIAHEIGNPLSGAATFVEVIRRRAAAPDVVEGIERELQRIDRIVRSLLDFASPHEEALQPVSVATVLQTTFALLQAQGAFRGVHPRLDLAPDVPPILGLAHALEQALVNLLLNAVDAAPGGAVVLGAQRWAFEVASARQRRTNDSAEMAFPRLRQRRPSRVEFREGQPGALVFVADSGPGVPPQDREKVFEPFFTTKEPGRGTGLGLAIVARIVYDIGGVVWVDQAREGGAAFKMFFPERGEAGGGGGGA
jgi:signal transduction histidine kinase